MRAVAYVLGMQATLSRLVATDSTNTALLVQRTVLGLVMVPHGAQKVFGAFGGYGFRGTLDYFTGVLHIPAPLAILVIVGELAGAVMLIAGLGTRFAAAMIAAIMIGAVMTTHLQVGFFMNWFGSQQGEGFEYHLLALALAVPLAIWGGGRYALDGVLRRE